MKNTHLSYIIAAFAMIFFVAFTTSEQKKPWDVPDKYVKMENPVTADNASLKTGKKLWGKHCGSCHGKEGLGDGSKAKMLDTPAGDFTTDAFQSQSDGTLFYKTKFGRDDMPGYEKKIPYDEDLWHLVNYMRSFK